MSAAEKSGPPKTTARLMKSDEVEETMTFFEGLDWNITHRKLAALQNHMPCTYVLVDEDDHIAATFALTETNPKEYVLGNIVVKHTLRGRGLGRHIIQEICPRLVDLKALSLTAVPEATKFYESIGLLETEPPRPQVISHVKIDQNLLNTKLGEFKDELEQIRAVPFEQARLADLCVYDNSARTYDNSRHTRVITETSSIVMAENKSNGQVVGYAAPFLQRDELVYDGIIADSDAIALFVFSESLKQYPGVSEVKFQTLKSQPLLATLGQVIETYEYLVCVEGKPTPAPELKVYSVSDCDYTVH